MLIFLYVSVVLYQKAGAGSIPSPPLRTPWINQAAHLSLGKLHFILPVVWAMYCFPLTFGNDDITTLSFVD